MAARPRGAGQALALPGAEGPLSGEVASGRQARARQPRSAHRNPWGFALKREPSAREGRHLKKDSAPRGMKPRQARDEEGTGGEGSAHIRTCAPTHLQRRAGAPEALGQGRAQSSPRGKAASENRKG